MAQPEIFIKGGFQTSDPGCCLSVGTKKKTEPQAKIWSATLFINDTWFLSRKNQSRVKGDGPPFKQIEVVFILLKKKIY